jgi:hypothetical protein
MPWKIRGMQKGMQWDIFFPQMLHGAGIFTYFYPKNDLFPDVV